MCIAVSHTRLLLKQCLWLWQMPVGDGKCLNAFVIGEAGFDGFSSRRISPLALASSDVSVFGMFLN
jgi:hypothetical protein